MTTYKQKYHLKKTQPLLAKQKIAYLNYLKQPVKSQKATTFKNLPLKKRSINLKDQYIGNNNNTNNISNINNSINQKKKQQKVKNQRNQQQNTNQYSKQSVNININNKNNNSNNNNNINNNNNYNKHPNPNINSSTTIHAQQPQTHPKPLYLNRPHSVSIVRKVNLSSNKSLQYWKKSPIQNFNNFNLLHSVQSFFNRIIKPDNGCVCQQPCEFATKLFKWVDIPEFLVNQHYQSLKQQIYQKSRNHYINNFEQLIQSSQNSLPFKSPRPLSTKQLQFMKQKQTCFKQIKKDIDRTHSSQLTFQNIVFKRRLQNILKCYVIQDIKVGYIQGMNMILAGILYHVKQQQKCYGIFRKLLYSIRSIYLQSIHLFIIYITQYTQISNNATPTSQKSLNYQNSICTIFIKSSKICKYNYI